MILKILVLSSVLSQFDLASSFRHPTVVREVFFNSFNRLSNESQNETEFCNADKKIWVVNCLRTLIYIKSKNYMYKDVYLSFKSFTDHEAPHKCSLKKVTILENSVTEHSGIPQYMAPCYSRHSVLEEGSRVEDSFFYTAIQIYLNNDDIMIFEYHEVVGQYVLLDWVKKSKLSTDLIEDCLFEQEQPKSTGNFYQAQQDVYKYYIGGMLNTTEFPEDMRKIYMLMTTCMLVLRSFSYPRFQTHPELYERSSADTPPILVLTTVDVVLYGIEFRMTAHQCRGYRMMENGGLIQDSNMFAIAQGDDAQTIILLQLIPSISREMKYQPIEVITNVYAEFVYLVYACIIGHFNEKI